MNIALLSWLFIGLFSIQNVHITDAQRVAILEEAESAYQEGVSLQQTDQFSATKSFKEAATKFHMLTNAGVENGKLWYNTGNAYLQCGEIGEAIAAFRAAERYIPNNARLQANLKHARSLSGVDEQPRSSASLLEQLAFWHRGLPTSTKFWLGLICWVTLFTVLIVRQFAYVIAYKSIAIASAIASCALFASVFVDFKHQQHTFGVIVSEDAMIYSGPQADALPLIEKPLTEGLEFEVMNQRSDWIRIQLPNGQQGWIKKDDAQIVSLDDDSTVGT